MIWPRQRDSKPPKCPEWSSGQWAGARGFSELAASLPRAGPNQQDGGRKGAANPRQAAHCGQLWATVSRRQLSALGQTSGRPICWWISGEFGRRIGRIGRIGATYWQPRAASLFCFLLPVSLQLCRPCSLAKRLANGGPSGRLIGLAGSEVGPHILAQGCRWADNWGWRRLAGLGGGGRRQSAASGSQFGAFLHCTFSTAQLLMQLLMQCSFQCSSSAALQFNGDSRE